MKVAITINFIVLCFVISYQSSEKLPIKSTSNKGGYTISVKKNTSLVNKNSITIYGYAKNVDDETPLKGSFIKWGCNLINVDNNGFYKINEKPSQAAYLSCLWIGFKTVETEFFLLEPGDSINLDFYLSVDDRPLINCEYKSY